jgi:uncharacterized protein DUF3300
MGLSNRWAAQEVQIMKIVKRAVRFWGVRLLKTSAVTLLSVAVLFATLPVDAMATQDAQQDAQQPPPASGQAPAPQYTTETPEQLQQLVAPIALYPDSLVAQILSAATFPEQVVEADRWVQAHPDLKGDALGQAVDQMQWDPSVKALAAFPSVLGNMDKNLSWTSTLGDAYYNQQQDVMDAVQVMRQKAEQSGNLKTTPQQTVATQGSTIIIQPAQPDVVYVPAYNPWVVYGPPIVAWPGWYPYPGIWYGGPFLSFGVGFGIGFFGGFGWGWGHWGFDWHNHYVVYNHARYYSHSTTFYNRNVYYRGGRGVGAGAPGHGGYRPGAAPGRGGVYNHPGASPRPFEGDSHAARGYAQPSHGQTSTRSGAFSGYDHGGESRSYAARGDSSFHGGGSSGGSHGGGGGGGGHAGGGHH